MPLGLQEPPAIECATAAACTNHIALSHLSQKQTCVVLPLSILQTQLSILQEHFDHLQEIPVQLIKGCSLKVGPRKPRHIADIKPGVRTSFYYGCITSHGHLGARSRSLYPMSATSSDSTRSFSLKEDLPRWQTGHVEVSSLLPVSCLHSTTKTARSENSPARTGVSEQGAGPLLTHAWLERGRRLFVRLAGGHPSNKILFEARRRMACLFDSGRYRPQGGEGRCQRC